MEKVIDYLQNEVREAKSIVQLDTGEYELIYNNEVVKRKRCEFEIVNKVYKCIKGFMVDVIDGDGFTLEESGDYISDDENTLWEVDNDGINVTGSEVRLITFHKGYLSWIELDKDFLKEHFKEIEAR